MSAPLDHVIGDAPPRRAERGDEFVRMQCLRHDAVFGTMEDVIVRIRHSVREVQRRQRPQRLLKAAGIAVCRAVERAGQILARVPVSDHIADRAVCHTGNRRALCIHHIGERALPAHAAARGDDGRFFIHPVMCKQHVQHLIGVIHRLAIHAVPRVVIRVDIEDPAIAVELALDRVLRVARLIAEAEERDDHAADRLLADFIVDIGVPPEGLIGHDAFHRVNPALPARLPARGAPHGTFRASAARPQ